MTMKRPAVIAVLVGIFVLVLSHIIRASFTVAFLPAPVETFDTNALNVLTEADEPPQGHVRQYRHSHFDWEENSRLVREWRAKVEESGSQEEASKNTFQSKTVFPCENTFLDFGANVGDTLRRLIDAGLPAFNRRQYLFDVDAGGIGSHYYGERKRHTFALPRFIRRKMGDRQPEDFCYYGVEGNPGFTSLLKDIEIKTMNLYPRPVRHVHYLTEHVGTKEDGPTTLYLDTVNKEDNFWGSSIYQTHSDVVRSGNDTGVPVTGITLSTLIRKTVLPFGHVIINMDIEGAEYGVIEEALQSGVLCEFCKVKNVTMAMTLELHHDATGIPKPQMRRMWADLQERLIECGVDLRNGDMDN